MRQKTEKTAFITYQKTAIKNRELLRQIYNTTFQDVLKKYDGKVYNKRFETALNDELKKLYPGARLFTVSEDRRHGDSYSNFKDEWRVTFKLCIYNDRINYVDKEELCTVLIFDLDENCNLRINAEKSKSEKYTVCWGENFDKGTEELRQVIKNYDKYLKVAQKVADAINEFKELPHVFRQNIYFSSLFYLNH